MVRKKGNFLFRRAIALVVLWCFLYSDVALGFQGNLGEFKTLRPLPIDERGNANAEEPYNPYLRGVVPPLEVLEMDRLNVKTTVMISAGEYASGMVGAGSEKRDEVDGIGQDIYNQVHSQEGVNVVLCGFEGAKHVVYREDVEHMVHEGGTELRFAGATEEEFELADVTENTGAILRGQPDKSGAGGSSLDLSGPLVRAFGGVKDELGAAMVIGAVPPDKMHLFLKSKGGVPLDPDLSVVANIQRILDANGIGWDDAEVFIMERPRAEEEYLKPLRQKKDEYSGLEITLVKDGSYDGGLLSILGRKEGKFPIVVGTMGSTEGVANYLEALVVDGIVVGLRLYAPFSKTIGDVAGSMKKTLAQLTPDEVVKVKAKTGLTDEEYQRLPQDIPITRLFTDDFKAELKKVRPLDTEEICGPDGKLFHNETLTFPRTEADPPEIRLHDMSGNVINRIPNVSWRDRIFSAATSSILSSRTLGLVGPKAVAHGQYKVQYHVLERVNAQAYSWVRFAVVTWEELKHLAGRLFSGDVPDTELIYALREKDGFAQFLQLFRDRLIEANNQPETLVANFESAISKVARYIRKSEVEVRDAVLHKLRYLAQDPGAPFGQPPDSWRLVANYLYIKLQQDAIRALAVDEDLGSALKRRLLATVGLLYKRDPADPEVIEVAKRVLAKQFGEKKDPKLRDRIRFNYNSFFYRDGMIYFSVDIMTGAEKKLSDGVKSELLISVPVQRETRSKYTPPYKIAELDLAGRKVTISIFDPLDFLKKNFMGRSLEAGLFSQRDLYEAWQAEYAEARALIAAGNEAKGMEKQHTLLRTSDRALNASDSFRGFGRAIMNGNTVLHNHMVHTIGSEGGYANMNATTSVANLVLALFKEGMLGKVPWCFEADHTRPEDDSKEQEDYVLRVVDEIARGGVHSGITIDTTKKIKKDAKTPEEKYGEALRFARDQLVRLDKGLKEQEKREPGSVFFQLDKWYVEIDLAVDKIDHTLEEMDYIARAAKNLEKEFGCVVNVVPGIGFTHGATAADLKLQLLEELTAVNRSVLGENTGIASHAGSGLDKDGLGAIRRLGAFAINKSTEFGNILLAVLRDSEVESDRELYNRIWDAIFDWYIEREKDTEVKIPDDMKKAVLEGRKKSQGYERPYDFGYNEGKGTWLVTNERTKWLANEQRQWIGLRDKHGRLVFHNDLVWGISEQAWERYAERVKMTISNYHSPDVMNGNNMAPVVMNHLSRNWNTLGKTAAYHAMEKPFLAAHHLVAVNAGNQPAPVPMTESRADVNFALSHI